MLSSAPSLPPGVAPSAEAVRRARDGAIELAMVAAANGTPRRTELGIRDLQSVAILLEHGVDGVRLRPTLAVGHARLEASLQVAPRSWLNLDVGVRPRGPDFPEVSSRIGAWRVPPPLVDEALALIDRWLARRGEQLPPLASTMRGLVITRERASATMAIPARMLRAVRELGGESPAKVDERLLRFVYGRLLEFQVRQPKASFAMTLRRTFGDRPADADPVAWNRAAFIALAMHTVDTEARRLAGADVMYGAVEEVQPPDLRVGGRADLAKHFALSAALTASFDPRFTRAMGEWKELDDSLPGGSGFSFIDLTADRAGLHLARAAVDPATASAVADALADTNDVALFPTAAHALSEGLAEKEFNRRYGGLTGANYTAAVQRVDRLLERLPLYAPFVEPN
ncbi:hypothetical protein ACFOMD_10605 [Sphingoaurantiacus capsulatus]|uniref:Uncharacterized protein n=1 Tax=Sphingoaurantiacus capsulatus TaxID=1771310 RepID=A0ABV7XA65_9SPHN